MFFTWYCQNSHQAHIYNLRTRILTRTRTRTEMNELCGNFSFWRLRKPIPFARSTYNKMNCVNHVLDHRKGENS